MQVEAGARAVVERPGACRVPAVSATSMALARDASSRSGADLPGRMQHILGCQRVTQAGLQVWRPSGS